MARVVALLQRSSCKWTSPSACPPSSCRSHRRAPAGRSGRCWTTRSGSPASSRRPSPAEPTSRTPQRGISSVPTTGSPSATPPQSAWSSTKTTAVARGCGRPRAVVGRYRTRRTTTATSAGGTRSADGPLPRVPRPDHSRLFLNGDAVQEASAVAFMPCKVAAMLSLALAGAGRSRPRRPDRGRTTACAASTAR